MSNAGATAPLLAVWGVHKRFGGHEVLCDISFEMRRGERICLLGPSGSGKSTLLRCVNWLEQPDHGKILLNGQPVGYRPGGTSPMSDVELARLRTRIGMVFQSFALWPHLTVLGNIIAAPIHVQRRRRDEAVA